MDNRLYPYLSLTMAMIIVGSSVAAGKAMIQDLPVFLASAIRFLLALTLLLPLLKIREGGLPVLSRRSWTMLGLQALCGSFLFTVCLLFGLRHTPAGSAGVITSTTPAWMAILAWIFFHEPPRLKTYCGIVLSVIGILLVSGLPFVGLNSQGWIGSILVLAAVLFEAAFLLLRKTVPEPISPLAAATIVSLFAFFFFLPLGLWEGLHFEFKSASSLSWLLVAYYGVVVTVLAYLFWFQGIVRVKAAKAGVFTAVMPVSALLCSALFLGEPITLANLLGCLCVVGSIGLMSLSTKKSPASN